MNIIDGKKIAKQIREDIAKEVETFERPPGLAVILVGKIPHRLFMFVIKNLHVLRQDSFLIRLSKSEKYNSRRVVG